MYQLLVKIIFRILLHSPCGRKIPRSGEDGESVNCYIVYLYENEVPFLVVKKINQNTLSGIQWDGKQYSNEKTISIFDLKNYKVRITHHYGLYTIKYFGVWNFVMYGMTKYKVIKCNIHKLFNNTSQFIFNRRRLATFERIEILRSILDFYFKETHNGFTSIDIMTKLYTSKWIVHPESESQHQKIDLFLESFLESGELVESNGYKYSVTGKAITTLSEYEKEERRYVESRKIQNRLVWFTAAIVIVGIIQAIVTYWKD